MIELPTFVVILFFIFMFILCGMNKNLVIENSALKEKLKRKKGHLTEEDLVHMRKIVLSYDFTKGMHPADKEKMDKISK